MGSERHGQVVRLAAPKCTIGSAEGCTLRLRAAGVRPLHCIILRGSHGTAIRCWARDTRLNGLPFGDSLLAPGDRLSIGPIEFDVLDGPACAETVPTPNDRGTIVRASCPPSVRRPSTVPSATVPPARVARQRARKLVAAIRRLQAEISDLQSRPAAHDSASFDSSRVELEQRIAEFQQERDKFETARQGAQSRLGSPRP